MKLIFCKGLEVLVKFGKLLNLAKLLKFQISNISNGGFYLYLPEKPVGKNIEHKLMDEK